MMYAVSSSVSHGSVLGPLEFVTYTEDAVEITHQYQLRHHIYANDMLTPRSKTSRVCCCSFKTVSLMSMQWRTSRRLQYAKIELYGLAHVAISRSWPVLTSLLVGGNIIKPSTTIRDQGVLLDSELLLKQHVNKVVTSC